MLSDDAKFEWLCCLLPSTRLLLQTEGPANPGTGSVITTGKAGRGPVIPVAVEGDVPFQIADELDVVGRVSVETKSARIRERRQKSRGRLKIGFAEFEELGFRIQQRRGNVLLGRREVGLSIVRALPRQAAEDGD